MLVDNEEKNLRCLFAIKKIDGVGSVNAVKLLAYFESPAAIFAASETELKKAGLKQKSIQSAKSIDFNQFDVLFEWLQQPNHHLVPIGSTYYPPLLSQTASPPLFLFAIGNVERLLDPQIAVVGSRSPSPQGVSNTQAFCTALVDQGLTVTSGLALGIDGEAHRATLKAGGYTIAVTGTGLNIVYPPRHVQLAHAITEKGVIVSECFPDEKITAGCFPRRNRIIAGLALGTLVVEAAKKSGSLITAHVAMEESREVFAIPSSIHNPLAKGCHFLIRQGAKLVETCEDIMEELPALIKAQQLTHVVNKTPRSDSRPQLNKETAEFLKWIDYETTSIDRIVIRSQLSVETVANKLLLLELDGWILNTAGGYTRL